MKRLGIIADTHNHLPPLVLELFQGVDHILHAGDIGEEWIVEELRTIAPVTAVLGNNDCLPHYKKVERREFNGVRYYITHILPRHLPWNTDWLIFGHTHVPRHQIVHGLHLFNPGCVSQPKGVSASVALLNWENNQWQPQFLVLNERTALSSTPH